MVEVTYYESAYGVPYGGRAFAHPSTLVSGEFFAAASRGPDHRAPSLTEAIDGVWPEGEIVLKADKDGEVLGVRTSGVWFGRNRTGAEPLRGLPLLVRWDGSTHWYAQARDKRDETDYYNGPMEAARAYVDANIVTPLTEFTKHDQSKPRADLLPPRALLAMADVLAYGASKYSDDNWRKGGLAARPRYIAAALRHILAFQGGEELDPESGRAHLAHALTSLAFAFELEGVGE